MIIGYAYVVGDILHTGHLLHLRNCKALCDRLIVGVLTESAVMEKKPRPSVPFAIRVEMVRALECVDAAVAQDTYSPFDNVWAIGPDVLFESQSHERASYDTIVDRVIWMPYYPETSSTQIKETIRCGGCKEIERGGD